MVSTFIKVKFGCCGIKRTNAKDLTIYESKTPADGAFECEIEQAKRLVKLGVAEYVSEDKAPEETGGGHLDAKQLEGMTNDSLKNLAGDLGIDVSGCKKKADYIEAIMAAEIKPGEKTDGADGDDDNDDDVPPAPGAADPE